jgi:hypothetical protein
MGAAMWVGRQFGYWLTAAAAAGMCAAADMPSGYFRGAMVSFEGSPTSGVLTARDAGGDSFECGYDGKSYLELAKQRINASKLLAGDRLEVLVDRSGRDRSCYIRILHVLPSEPARPTRAAKAQRRPARSLRPLTTVTVSGVVVRNENGSITVRGREGEESMLVRRDTRFFGDGMRTDADGLGLNQRVFVEAGRDLDGNLEAYQVTWGGILTVR